MNIADILQQSGALDSISRELGVSPAVARTGAEALLPSILGGFKKRAQGAPGGLGGLGEILGGLGGGGLLDAVTDTEPTPIERGNDVLGEIFGSKDVSRTVAGQASQRAGIDSSLLKKMLPLLAMAVAGYLARQNGIGAARGNGGFGGILGSVFGSLAGGGRQQPVSGGAGGSFGGLGALLDFDGDGNPLDDIIGMAGRMRG